MIRFLPGLIILQLLVALTTWGAIQSGQLMALTAVGVLILVSSVFFALWLKSQVQLHSKDEIAKHREKFAREREELRVKAEREKMKVVKDTQKQFTKESSRANAKANFKVGAAVAGAIGVGSVLVVSQMVTLGLLTLTTAGGGIAGYLVRARQDKKLLAGPGDDADGSGKKLSKPKVINALPGSKKKA
ncbi:hypothetical protein Q4485_07960 [Granulosicoccaceae sp. 1_MG-2023]|nr:hypothetical protein [Granulosicoccaceae sp. 1_MG-2023]